MNPIDSFRNHLNSLVSLEPLEWNMLSTFISIGEYKEKELLDTEGELSENVYFLVNGAIRIFRNVNGKDCTFNLYSTPCFIANIRSLINGSPSAHSIQSLTKTTVITIRFTDAQKLYSILPKYERIGRMLTESALLQEMARIDELTCYEPFERFVRLQKNNPMLMTLIPQKYVASYLGISPESLSRMKAKIIDCQAAEV